MFEKEVPRMTRRSWLLGVAMMSLTAGGVWAGMTLARTGKSDCCADPTCPPGCSESCPPDCLTTAAKPATVDCCDDPTCPPGCCEDCPPNCKDVTAKAPTTKVSAKESCCDDGPCCSDGCCPTSKAPATKAPVTKAPEGKKFTCPPCPFCPGW